MCDKAGARFDLELFSAGMEVAVFRLKAGIRNFTLFVAVIAEELEVDEEQILPYVRAWHNGTRDLVKDFG